MKREKFSPGMFYDPAKWQDHEIYLLTSEVIRQEVF